MCPALKTRLLRFSPYPAQPPAPLWPAPPQSDRRQQRNGRPHPRAERYTRVRPGGAQPGRGKRAVGRFGCGDLGVLSESGPARSGRRCEADGCFGRQAGRRVPGRATPVTEAREVQVGGYCPMPETLKL